MKTIISFKMFYNHLKWMNFFSVKIFVKFCKVLNISCSYFLAILTLVYFSYINSLNKYAKRRFV